MLEELFVFPNDSNLASGWNWIRMTLGSICDIYKVNNERLAPSESKWSLKGNMMNAEEKEVCRQERRSAWCGVRGGQGECWWWLRSTKCNWGEQSQANEGQRGLRSVYSAEQPSMLSIAEWGGMLRVRDQIEALQIEVGEGIEKRLF